MNESTTSSPCLAIDSLEDLLSQFGAELMEVLELFLQQPLTPSHTFDVEHTLQNLLRQFGCKVLEQLFNQFQPSTFQDCPSHARMATDLYRRRGPKPNTIATLFGSIVLNRSRYEAVEPGEPSIVPLEMALGIEAGLATPALAEQVGLWSVDHSQKQVLHLLSRHHEVSWSVDSLRKVTASLHAGMASFRLQAQRDLLLELLSQAEESKGRHRPVLAVGRDGVMVPIRHQGYQEASTATVTVYNRKGKRLATVYLGRMPESLQPTLSSQMSELLEAVLQQWQQQGGKPPRLVYITDKGQHQEGYYQHVLKKMKNPWNPDQKLRWEWVLDFWHVTAYVWKLAEALFAEEPQRLKWFRNMRHWLRNRDPGVANILRSACRHLAKANLTRSTKKAFWKAYRFLRRYSHRMHYSRYKREGLPIGSGVTEAACKTLVNQRMKRSGMRWEKVSGQVIIDLRALVLSNVWNQAHHAWLLSKPEPKNASGDPFFNPGTGNAG